MTTKLSSQLQPSLGMSVGLGQRPTDAQERSRRYRRKVRGAHQPAVQTPRSVGNPPLHINLRQNFRLSEVVHSLLYSLVYSLQAHHPFASDALPSSERMRGRLSRHFHSSQEEPAEDEIRGAQATI